MLFNSWTFIVFLLVVFLGYYFGPSWLSRTASGQTAWLTLASFVFYGWHTPWLVILLAISTFVNAEAARRLLDPATPPPRRKHILIAALVFNLGALAFFKYASLFARVLLPEAIWEQVRPFIGHIPLPIGISFYTFQGISLVMDVYRAGAQGVPGAEIEEGPRGVLWFHQRTWFFKSFFPQLIAGPIVKAHEFFHQIRCKAVRDVDWEGAVKHLILGFFLKMVVADNLKDATAFLRFPDFQYLSKGTMLLMLYGFSFQIYADFWGYSTIAIGLGKLFGYELPINFKHPYLSGSITEFWRRWHISLSTWLRSYLYIPLGGNRWGAGRTYFNLFVVMFLGGLWHGAAWSYALWGTAHGVLLALERLLGVKAPHWDRPFTWTPLAILRTLITFNLVSALWLLFKLPEFSHVVAFVRRFAVAPWRFEAPQLCYILLLFSIPIVLSHLYAAMRERHGRIDETAKPAWKAWAEAGAYACMALLIAVNSGTPGEFIYFQF